MTSIALAINITLLYATPLIFAALGGVISEKAGVINIGLEGLMSIGAFVGAVAAYYTKNPWLGLVGAAMASALLALLHAVASVTFRANQTISGIAINFIGPGIAVFTCRYIFGGTQSASVPNKIPKILSAFVDTTSDKPNLFLVAFNADYMIILALACVVIMWIVLYKTKLGLRITAVGEHPAAADTLGVNVYLIRYGCVIMSGVLAGLGGAARSISVVSQFSPAVISGHGYIALAAVIFGKWKPQGALGACFLFGFAQALIVLLGRYNFVSPHLLSMLPYLLTIIVLITFVGKSVAPKADGLPYEKGIR